MKTEAVMCMAFTRQRPSFTPLLRTRSSTVLVMLTKPRRPGTSNQSCSVSDFICRNLLQPAQCAVVADQMQGAIGDNHEPGRQPRRHVLVKAGFGTFVPRIIPAGGNPVFGP